MKRELVRSMILAGVVISGVLVFTLTHVTGQESVEQETGELKTTRSDFSQGIGSRALEGSWTVQVTIRNCQTGAAIRSIPRLNTFMQGGTMQETAAAGTSTAPVLRSPGHGVWAHTTEQSFYYAVQFLRLNADGGAVGSIRERRNVNVHILGNSYEATGTGEILDAAGNLLATTCATEIGSRFQ
jgi:hypothetical protein